jgi:hypothetical protein
MAAIIEPDTLLADCPAVGVFSRQPSPVSARIDALVSLAGGKGARTNRSELLGALILAAPEDPQELFDRVIEYRQARADAAAIKADSPSNVLEFKRHPRGPRKRSATQ